MKKSLLCGAVFNLGLFAGLCGCRPAGQPAGGLPGAGPEIKVMTFNVRLGGIDDGENSWDIRKEMVFEVFRSHKPDIACLQEPFRFQLDELRRALPRYGEVGAGREGGERGEYVPILYDLSRFTPEESGTFWFSDTPDIPGTNTWGNAYIRICSWARFKEKRTGAVFYVYNVHLDNESQAAREKSAALLVKRIQGRTRPAPFVLTGDFNVTVENPVIGYLARGAGLEGVNAAFRVSPVRMTDAFGAFHGEGAGAGTFHDFTGNRDGGRIDYIFAGPGIRPLDAGILHDGKDGRYPSDHFPLSALLRLPAREDGTI